MKLSVFVAMMAAGGATAFAPNPTTTSSSSRLNLFGGGGNKDGAAKPGGGIMDQMAMFKKAQEMAKKKQTLDSELASEDFKGKGADGKVTATVKFAPSKNPMDPSPGYETTAIDFDEEWFEGASTDDISNAVKDALMDGIEVTNVAVTEKYKALEEDIKNLQG